MAVQAEKLAVGRLETNCYIISGEGCCVVIDPGAEPERILSRINEIGLPLEAILLTHGHFDHIGAAARLKAETGAKIYMHQADAEMITDPEKSLSFMTGEVPAPFEPDFFVNDGDTLSIGGLNFSVMHTPGHSSGGVCYALGAVIFGGDLIFKCSVGRWDFGSYADEMASVKRVLASFPDETLIYPGHGPHTSVGCEKNFNPYAKEG